jgi:flagellar basal body rod protein FlgF
VIYPLSAGQNEDELSCSAGESITIVEDLGDGWLKVQSDKGGEGYVPESYVQK